MKVTIENLMPTVDEATIIEDCKKFNVSIRSLFALKGDPYGAVEELTVCAQEINIRALLHEWEMDEVDGAFWVMVKRGKINYLEPLEYGLNLASMNDLQCEECNMDLTKADIDKFGMHCEACCPEDWDGNKIKS